MKTVFTLLCWLIAVGYPVALAAHVFGLISFSAVSWSTFINSYTATRLLGFAFGDGGPLPDDAPVPP